MDNLSPAAVLEHLVRVPSVSSMSNRPLLEVATGILSFHEWHIRELPYRDAHGTEKLNLIALPPLQAPDNFAVDLAFVCHTDTVPYAASWSNATNPQIRDEALHGCGACDVKGFLACLLAAFMRVPAQWLAHSVALVLTADEEIGCLGTKRLMAENLLRPRNVVVGEPTSLQPARAGKGYGLAEIRVFGKEAHSAYPGQGVSAIYQAARLIGRIEQWAASLQHASSPAHTLFDPPYTTLNVGTVAGGTAKNIIAGECRFLLEWRPVPGEPAGAIPNALQAIADQCHVEDSRFRCEIDLLREQEGFETREESPLIRRWSQITGHGAIGVPFGTEAPLFATLSKDIVVLGPGDMRTAHSDRECVPLSDLELCVAGLQELLTHPF